MSTFSATVACTGPSSRSTACINEERLIAKADNGQELVFLVDDPVNNDNLVVGDKLELRLDEQTHSAVILNVFPQRHEERTL